jgi:hypothetical protein
LNSGSDFVILFKTPTSSEPKVKVKFMDDSGEEVEEVIHIYYGGDYEYNLIVLVQFISAILDLS